ncbi:MAG: YihY/virulence factor BrkB family protein, partial [Clostridiales bacterium]|nr:YihY/virulence factor BrkB family protein [Clostridiales bacterium]
MDFDFIKKMIKRFSERSKENRVNAYAAQAAFFVILAFFPFVMAMLALVRYLPFSASDINIVLDTILPQTLADSVSFIIEEVFSKATGTLFSLSIIATLWSAGKGMLALVRGLNAVYEINETRNYFKLRGISTIYTCIFMVIIIITVIALGFGKRIFELATYHFPQINELAYIIMSLRTATTLFLLIIFFLLLFTLIPNRKSKFKYELPGAVISACGWILFTYIFEYYIDRMGTYSYLFGSL